MSILLHKSSILSHAASIANNCFKEHLLTTGKLGSNAPYMTLGCISMSNGLKIDFQNDFFSETIKPRALIFTSYKFVHIMATESKWPCTGGHMFYIGLYRENIKKSSCLKPLDIWNVASPSRLLPSLCGPTMVQPRCHMFIGFRGKNLLVRNHKA